MILRYSVSLPGIKGFSRVYEVKDTMTLYDFHKRMRDDMSFSHDQLILFKAFNESLELVGRYGMFNLGSGTVDEVTLGKTFSKGITSFTYFYDVTNKKSVIITLEGQVQPTPGAEYPRLVFSKGPDPIEFENGYVAYEDLPEDQKHHPVETKPFAKGMDKEEGELDDDLFEEDIDDEDDKDEDDVDVEDEIEKPEERSDPSELSEMIIYNGSEDFNY